MLPKAHLTSHSRMSGSRWVITPSWLSGSWRFIINLIPQPGDGPTSSRKVKISNDDLVPSPELKWSHAKQDVSSTVKWEGWTRPSLGSLWMLTFYKYNSSLLKKQSWSPKIQTLSRSDKIQSKVKNREFWDSFRTEDKSSIFLLLYKAGV